ncbi:MULTISPECIES: hypothetical protein [unclassified Clostridioides]|uniref:hypothetical protein n=1 Tax=unclassified Clostridioides TaxID=2635829 RepID=UPI001D0FB539|nr:hypothetical protein [Clostridioides sp. ES-S-0171-01]MCC0689704.1 hypothetical protein [Clostridioides sp. ES-S-0056-01]MCC0716798.1 hypothetical protein [Clostridioides sp. ES-S-0077-01]
MSMCRKCLSEKYLDELIVGECILCGQEFFSIKTPVGKLCPSCSEAFSGNCSQCTRPAENGKKYFKVKK